LRTFLFCRLNNDNDRYTITALRQAELDKMRLMTELQNYKQYIDNLSGEDAVAVTHTHGGSGVATAVTNDEYNDMVDRLADAKRDVELQREIADRLRSNNNQLRQQLQDHGIRALNVDSEKARLTNLHDSTRAALDAQVRALQAENQLLRSSAETTATASRNNNNNNGGNGGAYMGSRGGGGGPSVAAFDDLRSRYASLKSDYDRLHANSRELNVRGFCKQCEEREKTLLVLQSQLDRYQSESNDIARLMERNQVSAFSSLLSVLRRLFVFFFPTHALCAFASPLCLQRLFH
jgi:hypothetical protein